MSDTWQYFQNPENRARVLASLDDSEAGDVLDIAAIRENEVTVQWFESTE